jgi:hypothetical protein
MVLKIIHAVAMDSIQHKNYTETGITKFGCIK